MLCCAGYAISASLLEGVLSDGKGPLVSYPSSLFVVSSVSRQAAAELRHGLLSAILVKLPGWSAVIDACRADQDDPVFSNQGHREAWPNLLQACMCSCSPKRCCICKPCWQAYLYAEQSAAWQGIRGSEALPAQLGHIAEQGHRPLGNQHRWPASPVDRSRTIIGCMAWSSRMVPMLSSGCFPNVHLLRIWRTCSRKDVGHVERAYDSSPEAYFAPFRSLQHDCWSM